MSQRAVSIDHAPRMWEPEAMPLHANPGTIPRGAPRQTSEDPRDFQAFYQEHLPVLYRYVYSKVGQREEAEDLTSQVFLKALRGVEIDRDNLSVQKWLFQVARTTIADYWRSVYRRGSPMSLEVLLDEGWEIAEETDRPSVSPGPVERVQQVLHALSERDREVLTCRFLLQLSVRETAQRMGLTQANVKIVQYRAIRRAAALDECLKSGAREETGSHG